MHVHANYSQQMASLGASRNEAHDTQARRAAEVRKKLSTASSAILGEMGDAVAATSAKAEEDRYEGQHKAPDEGEYGRLFSARA